MDVDTADAAATGGLMGADVLLVFCSIALTLFILTILRLGMV